MRAFKGCVNKDCRAYKRTRYKSGDKFCNECGGKLEYVCADCWAPMKNDKERYCKDCVDRMDARRVNAENKIKETGRAAFGLGKKATKAIPAAASTIRQIKPDAKELIDDGKKVVKAGAKAGKKAANAGKSSVASGKSVLAKGLAVGLRAGKTAVKAGAKAGKKVAKAGVKTAKKK